MPACTWFLEIAFIYASVFLCVCVRVRVRVCVSTLEGINNQWHDMV